MLQNVERPLEFRCLHCEDANLNSSTTKLTEPILRKGTCSQKSSTDTLAFSTYNILMMTWKKTSETGLQTFPTRGLCTSTFIIKFMMYYTISSAHPVDALDMIDQIILSCLILLFFLAALIFKLFPV